jgi:hypothetical protein
LQQRNSSKNSNFNQLNGQHILKIWQEE